MNDDERYDLLAHTGAVITYERRRRLYSRLVWLLLIAGFAALILLAAR